MKYFAGLLAIVALVAGATVGAYHAWDRATHTKDDNGGVLAGGPTTTSQEPPRPAEGQVAVTGKISTAHSDGAVVRALPTPLTVTTANRGEGGATITPVTVNGKETSIEWNAGQPLSLEGDGGSLVLGPIAVDVAADISLVLDGVHSLAPGTYTINTSVAVGSTPKDSVTFTATDTTTIEFRGTASTPPPTPGVGAGISIGGNGAATISGDLTIERPDGSTTPASSITLDNGAYLLNLTPDPAGGFTVQATLQGPVH